MIYHWATNRTDPQNLLSTTLDCKRSLNRCDYPLLEILWVVAFALDALF